MEDHVVTHGLHIRDREGFVVHLDLLQADHVRLVLVDKGLQLMKTGAQAIDIERDDLHVRGAHVVLFVAYWTRESAMDASSGL